MCAAAIGLRAGIPAAWLCLENRTCAAAAFLFLSAAEAWWTVCCLLRGPPHLFLPFPFFLFSRRAAILSLKRVKPSLFFSSTYSKWSGWLEWKRDCCRFAQIVASAVAWAARAPATAGAGAAVDTCSWMPPLRAADVFDSSLIACVDTRVGTIQSRTPFFRFSVIRFLNKIILNPSELRRTRQNN